jgi:predicted lactoylglutathione lyase
MPYDGNPATFGNGVMATLGAENREQVDKAHAAALANGGSDEGGPGVRENGYYVAYWRDPDGNKMNAVSLAG